MGKCIIVANAQMSSFLQIVMSMMQAASDSILFGELFIELTQTNVCFRKCSTLSFSQLTYIYECLNVTYKRHLKVDRSVTALLFNSLALYLIVTRSRKEIGSYKFLLITFLCTDTIFSVLHKLCQPVPTVLLIRVINHFRSGAIVQRRIFRISL